MPVAEKDWSVLLSLFSSEWEELGRQTGAVTHLQGFDSVGDVLGTLLMHVGAGVRPTQQPIQITFESRTLVNPRGRRRWGNAARWHRPLPHRTEDRGTLDFGRRTGGGQFLLGVADIQNRAGPCPLVKQGRS